MKDLELRKKGGELKFCVQWSVCGGNGPEAIRRLHLMPGDGLLDSFGHEIKEAFTICQMSEEKTTAAVDYITGTETARRPRQGSIEGLLY